MRVFSCLDVFAIKLLKAFTNIDDAFIGMPFVIKEHKYILKATVFSN